ncbi:KH domain-containing protein [Helicobacter jaachi]|uniref:KH domain-containing protein n=1 Tax=Helicobacter jaachi TaxID=1677920 RepID=A0A4V6YSA7_9HELI|nr:KH domain-containing protein [Helicobacter jaachi]TLD96782.1 KH domain-containing protein [Helicobacter jaachi]
MVEDFIKEYAKKIANNPEAIQIQIQDAEDNTREIIILADAQDVGRLIGRDGKMVGSLKTFISGTKAKDGKNYRIAIQAH